MAYDDAPLMCPLIERRVLGAALRTAAGRITVSNALTAADFGYPLHSTIFEALEGHSTDDGVDSPLLAHYLATSAGINGDLDPYDYLAELHEQAVPLAGLDANIAQIKSTATARGIAGFARTLATQAIDTGGNFDRVESLIQDAESRLRTIGEGATRAEWHHLGEAVRDLKDSEEDFAPIPTGFVDLDEKLGGGTRPGTMSVIAGRPGSGKSTLGFDMARHAAMRVLNPKAGQVGLPGLVISYEMSSRDLAKRWLSAESGVNLSRVTGDVDDREYERLQRVLPAIEAAPLYIADSLPPTVSAMCSIITAAHRYLGIAWVLCDYLQLVDSIGTGAQVPREAVISAASRGFRETCRQGDITGWMAAQLNRNPESRQDKKPQVSDLRESGSIEQDADLVLLIHQAGLLEESGARIGEADIIFGKHRNGTLGTVTLAPQFHYARFASMAAGY